MNNTLATHKEKQPVSDTRVTLRQDLPAAQARLYGVMGLVGLMVLWFIITTFRWVSPGTLPPIPRVIKGFSQLFTEEDLLHHMGVSIFLNASGYLEARKAGGFTVYTREAESFVDVYAQAGGTRVDYYAQHNDGMALQRRAAATCL